MDTNPSRTDEPLVVFWDAAHFQEGQEMSLTDLKGISSQLRRRRREWEAEKRRVEKVMSKIRVDMERLYPNENLVEALALLLDQDLVWSGDFDLLREPLAELLLKLHACGVFTEDVDRLTQEILYIPSM